MNRRRYSPEELHARLIVVIGIILAVVFSGSVFAMLYALVFVTQPMAQAPNDAAFIDLVSTLFANNSVKKSLIFKACNLCWLIWR